MYAYFVALRLTSENGLFLKTWGEGKEICGVQRKARVKWTHSRDWWLRAQPGLLDITEVKKEISFV